MSNNIITVENKILYSLLKEIEFFLDVEINNNSSTGEKNLIFDDKEISFPIKIDNLVEKINIQLLKNKYRDQSNIKISNYLLNLNSRILSHNELKLKLTEKEINIILFLNLDGKAKSIQQLQEKVWGYSSNLETHTVETHIYRLRKKIFEKFKDDTFILSGENGYKVK